MSNYIKEYKPHLEWWNNIPDEGDGLFITKLSLTYFFYPGFHYNNLTENAIEYMYLHQKIKENV